MTSQGTSKEEQPTSHVRLGLGGGWGLTPLRTLSSDPVQLLLEADVLLVQVNVGGAQLLDLSHAVP